MAVRESNGRKGGEAEDRGTILPTSVVSAECWRRSSGKERVEKFCGVFFEDVEELFTGASS